MTSGNWFNNDGLYLEFGTTKPVAETWGDFVAYGSTRIIEGLVDISTLTTTPLILSQNTFFPPAGNTANFGGNSNTWFIERVELVVETAVATITSFSLGLIQDDRATTPANYDHAFINAELTAAMATAGDIQVYVGADSIPAGSTKGGTLIGSTAAAATGPYYITAKIAGATGTGKVRIRIFYRGIGTITQ